ncbi:hypothetical protein PF005_g4047 [Phytophthora fragariae]|uniref:Secreted protein n=1 Tax=Phytophthora fragariae TaxID=53985 RepID=A0A6A4BBB8_9STRA|nr:hypothetical protein PF003_g16430 [Phytophthora fragariae]KAE8928942.1 hypothetical protein PF009_g20936 [Phytophthora fragariae]KAE9024939.1 hypothetical protein PF011_g3278 [Phytophthora fragariae]KAE9079046.1 hypothetical protein PF006_g27595 [Phytophthora fragariae]KAE9095966.1 hypothetical protein PF010_g16510 [Phytophthora fragariae]
MHNALPCITLLLASNTTHSLHLRYCCQLIYVAVVPSHGPTCPVISTKLMSGVPAHQTVVCRLHV